MSDAPHPKDDRPPRRKKRGAPLGNTNALKHGGYSRRFRSSSSGSFENTNLSDLPGHIYFLKAYIREVRQLSAQMEAAQDENGSLRSLDLAMQSLDRLLRMYQRIPGSAREKAALRSALVKGFSDFYEQRSAAHSSSPGAPPEKAS